MLAPLSPSVSLLLSLLALAAPLVTRGQPQTFAPSATAVRELIAAEASARDRMAEVRTLATPVLAETPQPVATIVSQGRLMNDPERIRSLAALRDMGRIHALASVWLVEESAAHAAKAREFILAWIRTNHSTGDAINDTKLEPLLWACDWLASTWSADEQALLNAWLRELHDRVLRARALPPSRYNNNFSHRIKTAGLCALLLHDAAAIARIAELLEAQIRENLRPDGSSFDFHERDALHYHCYTLEPLLTLAIAYRAQGRDYYHHVSTTGSSLEKSVRFLLPYCTGEKTHGEFAQSKNEFDRQRGEAGDRQFVAGRPFAPREALRTLELAAAFDPTLRPRVATLAGQPEAAYPTWNTVILYAPAPPRP
jgi:hypothetical protein